MAATIGALRVELAANVAKFQEDMGKAASSVKGLQRKFDAFGAGAMKAGGALTAGLTAPILAVGAGLAGLVTSAAKTGDAIAKTAREAGLSSEDWQELSFALQHVAQVSDENLARAFGNLTARIGDAAEGNKSYATALRQVGFSQEEIASGSITTEQAFRALTQAMQDAESPALAAAVAADLLGQRSGRQLAGALREGGDQIETLRDQARSLGLVMSEDATAASEAFNDAMSDLKQEASAVARDLGVQLIPILTDKLFPVIRNDVIPAFRDLVGQVSSVVDWFTNLSPPVQKAIAVAAGLAAALGPVLVAVGAVASGISAVLPILAGLKVAIVAIGTIATGPVGLLIGAVTAVWLAFKNWDKITEIAENVFRGVREWVVDRLGGALGRVKEKIDNVVGWFHDMRMKVVGNSEVVEMVDGVSGQFRRMGDVMIDEARRGTTGVTDAMKVMANELRIKGHEGIALLGEFSEGFVAFGVEGVKALDSVTMAIGRNVNAMRLLASEQMLLSGSTGVLDQVFADFRVEAEQAPSLFANIGSHITNLGKRFTDVSQIFQSVTAGIFGPQGFIANLAMQGMQKLGSIVIGGIKSLGKKIGGFFKGIFGGPSDAELAGREAFHAYRDAAVAGLTDGQIREAAQAGWANPDDAALFISIRDTFAEVGGNVADAERVWDQLVKAMKVGPGAVQAVIDQYEALVGRMRDANGVQDQLTAGFGEAANMADAMQRALHALPSSFNFNISAAIPRLAKGGIVAKPTLAVVGEAGPEAVVPLSGGGSGGVLGGTERLEAQLSSISRSLAMQPDLLSIAIRSALAQARV